MTGARRRDLALAFFLVLAVFALYGQTARHGFVSYDDGAYIDKNRHVRKGLTAENVRWAFTEFHSANWHPLTWLSHQLDVELFGLDAGKHHLMNAGWHALNAVLLYVFLRRATDATRRGAIDPGSGAPESASGTVWASALAALLFAVHPLRVESVAWASERKDVLAGTFFFLTLIAYERYTRAPSARRYALVALALALGLLAKPMLVTVPAVLLLLDFWPLRRFASSGAHATGAERRPALRLMVEKLPLLALCAASSVVTVVAQTAGGAVRSTEMLSYSERFATAVLGLAAYVAKTFLPVKLAFFYPHPAFVTPAEFAPLGARVLLTALGLAALTYGAWRARGRLPMLLAGWGWTLVMLLPVIGLVQVGMQLYADRYVYLPFAGFTFALVFAARELCPPQYARKLFLAGLGVAGALFAVAWRQVGQWRDNRTLFEHALRVTEHNFVAHEHLGIEVQRGGDLERARDLYLATLARAPDRWEAHSNLGTCYMELGEREKALACYREALRIKPDFLQARLNWGLLHEREGDPAAALPQFEIAVREHPDADEAWTKLGDTYLALGRPADARVAFLAALALETRADALAGLGKALAELGDERAALAHFDMARRLLPDSARALLGEAWIRATSADPALRDPPRAFTLLQAFAARGTPPGWAFLRVQAAALAAVGRYQEAARAAAEALALAPRPEWERLEAERKTYAAGRALGS